MYDETVYKGIIKKIDCSLYTTDELSIFFRLINFNNNTFFAEEASTGCIFPIYCFTEREGNSFNFFTNSYLEHGLYFVYCPIDSNSMFKYEFQSSFKERTIELADIDELNKYLRYTFNNKKTQNRIRELEKENIYFCDVELIKEEIKKLKTGNYIVPSRNNIRVYNSKIDLKEISDYGYDLSTQKDLCNLVGREHEKKKIIKTVCIGNDSVLLIGESGSGKTAIVESLALDIKNEGNEWLKGKTIFNLNVGSLVAGTKYRGDFEEKLKKVIEFCKKNNDKIIIFIDEIHMLYKLGATDNDAIDAMNILKPYISSGDITIIGATTKMEYEKYMANDPAFLRRFEKVDITPPDLNMNVEILLNYVNSLEDKYNTKLKLTDEQKSLLAKYLIEITDIKNQRVVGEIKESNPTISKKILKDAFEDAVYNKNKNVTHEDIYFAILSCPKLSPTLKKDKAQELKRELIGDKEKQKDNKGKVLVLSNYQ